MPHTPAIAPEPSKTPMASLCTSFITPAIAPRAPGRPPGNPCRPTSYPRASSCSPSARSSSVPMHGMSARAAGSLTMIAPLGALSHGSGSLRLVSSLLGWHKDLFRKHLSGMCLSGFWPTRTTGSISCGHIAGAWPLGLVNTARLTTY